MFALELHFRCILQCERKGFAILKFYDDAFYQVVLGLAVEDAAQGNEKGEEILFHMGFVRFFSAKKLVYVRAKVAKKQHMAVLGNIIFARKAFFDVENAGFGLSEV